MMTMYVDNFRKYAPCLLHLDFGGAASSMSWRFDTQGKAHRISLDTFIQLSISALRAGSHIEKQDLDAFVALIYPL